MTAYDVETKLPLCNEMFIGSDPDKTAAEAMFSRFHFENTLFLVDRGFNTAKDKALFSSDGNTYIVPMISGRDDYEAVYEVLKFDKRKSFVYDKDGYSSLIRYETYVIDDESVHYFAFLDTTRQSAERQTYIKKMSAGEKGYTQEGLLKSEKDSVLSPSTGLIPWSLSTSRLSTTPSGFTAIATTCPRISLNASTRRFALPDRR
jgi:hypothetical protein